MPARCDSVGQELEDTARATPKIDRALSRLQIHLVEDCSAEGAQLIGLALEPGALRGVPTQRVYGCRGRSGLLLLPFPCLATQGARLERGLDRLSATHRLHLPRGRSLRHSARLVENAPLCVHAHTL